MSAPLSRTPPTGPTPALLTPPTPATTPTASLGYSSGGGLDAWRHGRDLVEALKPTRVVAGHKDKTRDDDPSNMAATRKYLNDAKGLLAANPTQLQFFSQMMKLYPERLNPSILWISAQALLRDE